MGEPKATATPAALAAVKISLILPVARGNIKNARNIAIHTLTLRKARETTGNDESSTAGSMDGRPFFADVEPRSDDEWLQEDT